MLFVFLVLVVLEVPLLAFGVGDKAYKQARKENLCWILGSSFLHVLISLSKSYVFFVCIVSRSSHYIQ